jgi:peroxiredoxin
LQAKGLGLASISYDPPEVLSAFAKQHGITFPMLSDVGSVTIRKFGLLNPVPEWALGPSKDDPAVQDEVRKFVSVVRPNAAMIGVAFPGTLLLDRQGRVKTRYFEDFYIERNTVSSLMLKLGGKPSVAGTRISTAQLDVTTYPSDPALAPGNRFSVVLDIEPHAKMHVYAPGARGYRPIKLTIEQAPQIRILEIKYPQPEIYFFKPLNERVPVFQKPFRIVQEVTLEGTPDAQAALRGKTSVTVRGTLDYQACDEKECFNPVSLPLSWTMDLRSLVLERPTRQPGR